MKFIIYFNLIKSQIKYSYKKVFLLFFVLCGSHTNAQTNSTYLDSVLRNLPLKQQEVLKNRGKYGLQIVLTQINRDSNNQPQLTHHFYNYDSSRYFNPASTVKLPVSIFALEKINELKKFGVLKESTFITDSSKSCSVRIDTDSSTENFKPTIENYIKRMLLVSDNFSYSRVFDFLGIDDIHDRLKKYNHLNVRIKIKFDALCKNEESHISKPFYFTNQLGNLLYQQHELISTKKYSYPFGKAIIGKAYMNAAGKKINTPYDFTEKNFLPLFDLHKILARLVFHDFLREDERFNISKADWYFLMKYLSAYPRESTFPKYNEKIYFDAYKKYFIHGAKQKTISDSTFRIYNIVGQSYGFLIDCAYIVDFTTKTEFILSACIYVNERNIINSGRYEYDTIGFPFLKELGNIILKSEKVRHKKNLPDLSYLPKMN